MTIPNCKHFSVSSLFEEKKGYCSATKIWDCYVGLVWPLLRAARQPSLLHTIFSLLAKKLEK